MKKLEHLEKYVEVPDTQFYGAYFYNGEDIELHNEIEEFKDNDGNVETRLTIIDTIENGVFKKHKLIEDIKNSAKEEVNREFTVKEGDMLIFVQFEGFVKTHTKLVPVKEAAELISMLDCENCED